MERGGREIVRKVKRVRICFKAEGENKKPVVGGVGCKRKDEDSQIKKRAVKMLSSLTISSRFLGMATKSRLAMS